MANQSNLTGYAGDGPLTVNFQIFASGNPFNISTVTLRIVLKSSPSQPDPAGAAPNVFTVVSGGLGIVNAANGQGQWIIPATFTATPGNYWWHGTMNNGGIISTWGFGTLDILVA